jgi:hypothetical protein
MKLWSCAAVAWACASAAVACTGEIQDGANSAAAANSGGSGQTGAAGDLPYTPPNAETIALPARVWRHSHLEYRRSVKAFLGVDVDTSALPAEIDSGVYANMSGTNFVRVDLAEGYYDLAESLAAGLSTQQLNALVPCGEARLACKDEFISSMISKAFRRPAVAEDLTRYASVFDAGGSDGDATLGFRSVLQALLTSPFFLYRTEVGDVTAAPSVSFRLTDYEVASLLSYSLLGQPPTPELWAAAARGELLNPASLQLEVDALLEQPAAMEQLNRFLHQWLKLQNFSGITKFETAFPGYAGVKDAMLQEAKAFFMQVGLRGTLASLLTTPVPATGALQQFYGSDPTAPAGSVHVGILGLGATLSLYAKANRSSPTQRGLFVRERLLCQHVSFPPIPVPDLSKTEQRSGAKTTRELYEQHASDALCKGCHQLLDPIGFNFEGFDGAGRFRSLENGVPIDTSGSLTNTDVNGSFTSSAELAQALADSDWVRECAAIQAYRFYFGQVESGRGLLPIRAGYRALVATGTLHDLLAALLSSSSTIERSRR